MLSCFHRFSYDISICIFLMISEFCADRNGDFPTSASLTGVTLAAHTGKCRGTGPSWAHLTCRTLRNTEVTTFLILPCVTMMLQSKKKKNKGRKNLTSQKSVLHCRNSLIFQDMDHWQTLPPRRIMAMDLVWCDDWAPHCKRLNSAPIQLLRRKEYTLHVLLFLSRTVLLTDIRY